MGNGEWAFGMIIALVLLISPSSPTPHSPLPIFKIDTGKPR
ncbi:hypothetical protein COO91_06546 [Nostoc flagelliforme CCNUN1]|uniref:Uncharacterized protein n=1 Tax=Nostoc flagelliforme CCNUN1 TaxID=2038116 RepID=A0A2K8SYK5_9NOSO|nr:hypothetical protein COO91_06546 [Nostoc flagelliforme CCNUN1]